MRKTRRHKYLQLFIFFLIYSIIHVVSISNHDNESNQPTGNSEENIIFAPQTNNCEETHKQGHKHLNDKDTNHEHKNPQSVDLSKDKDPSTNISRKKRDQSPKPHSDPADPVNHLDEHQKILHENGTKHFVGMMTGNVHGTTKHTEATEKMKNDEEAAKNQVLNSAQTHVQSTVNNSEAIDKMNAEHKAKTHVWEKIHGHASQATSHTDATEKMKAEENKAKLHVLDKGVGHTSSAIKYGNETEGVKPETKASPSPTQTGTVESTVPSVENDTINSNDNCTPPAIKQFPYPIMSIYTIRHGGFILHIIVAVYMFLGLAIVCDEYFVASLDRICEELKMSPDVAGATFMAAGSSAPELATVIIGVFLAQDDIGISGVIGSAVFNIMFVIACCGLCSSVVIYLNWWPLIRDCFFYAVSILVMLGVIADESISWVESVILLVTYVIYCVVLHYNTLLESIAYSLPVPFKRVAPNEESGLVSYKTLDDAGKVPNYGMEWSPEKQQEITDQGPASFGAEWSPEKNQQGFATQLSGPDLNQATTEPPVAPQQSSAAPIRPIQQEYYKPREYDPSTQVNPLIKPEGASIYRLFTWAVVFPIHWLCRLTVPDCRSEKYKNWYPFTFFLSMIWISFYSYFMVWMITLIGYTMYIPDTVMGLTFVAAGVSVPDALSSIAVIKEGYGDMAVSNAVGSNVFDILVCLGLPWFLKTAIVNPGSTVKVKSKGLTYSTLSLLSTVVFLVVATHLNGWKLDRRYGIILMVWYLIFIAFASLYEFTFNPEQCDLVGW